MDLSIEAIMNAYFNAFDSNNTWFLDFGANLYVIKNKQLIIKFKE